METIKVRDRDYILDKYGVIYKVIGNYHDEYITAYIRYYPDTHGVLNFRGKPYKRNNFVYNSFKLVPSSDYIRFSNKLGTVVTQVPEDNIVEIFDSKQRLIEIIANSEDSKVITKLRQLLEIFQSQSIDISHLGVTASILVGTYNESSDIDLVTDSIDIVPDLHKLIYSRHEFQTYTKQPLTQALYERRTQSMGSIEFDSLLLQEKRKLQAIYEGVHFNIQPIRPINYESKLKDANYYYMGEIELIAKVTDDSEGTYSPALYGIEVLDIISSTIPIDSSLSITSMLSFIGVYSSCFKNGDKVYIRGKVGKQEAERSGFAVILDPWDNQQRNAARILLG